MHPTRVILPLAPVTLLLTACNSTAPLPSQRLNLSATTGSAAAHSSMAGATDLVVTGTGGSVKITSAQIVLSHIKLASDVPCANTGADNPNDADDASDQNEATESEAEQNDEHDCDSMHLDPVLVDLPLDGTTKVILDALVPAGTYTGLRAKLEAVEGDDDGGNPFITAHPEFQGVSVKVVGVFTDASGTDHAFTFTSDVEAELAMNFATPVTVGATTSNLTIDVNLGSWFKDATGAVIDPTNAANQRAIEQAIRASLSAFEDDDHDGDDDHAPEGAGGH